MIIGKETCRVTDTLTDRPRQAQVQCLDAKQVQIVREFLLGP